MYKFYRSLANRLHRVIGAQNVYCFKSKIWAICSRNEKKLIFTTYASAFCFRTQNFLKKKAIWHELNNILLRSQNTSTRTSCILVCVVRALLRCGIFFKSLFFFNVRSPVRDAVHTLAPRTRWQHYYYNYCFDYYFYGCYYNDYNSRRRTRTHSKRHPTVFGAFGFAISE